MSLGLVLSRDLLGATLPREMTEAINRDPAAASLARLVERRLFGDASKALGISAKYLFYLKARERLRDRVGSACDWVLQTFSLSGGTWDCRIISCRSITSRPAEIVSQAWRGNVEAMVPPVRGSSGLSCRLIGFRRAKRHCSRYGLILVQQVLVFMTFALTLALLQYASGAALSRSNLYGSVIIAVIYGYSGLCTGNLGCRCRVLSLIDVPFFWSHSFPPSRSPFSILTPPAMGSIITRRRSYSLPQYDPLRDVFLAAPGFPDYINYFPKAAWILAATLYKGTGLIETGKAVNLLLIVATFFSVRAALSPWSA